MTADIATALVEIAASGAVFLGGYLVGKEHGRGDAVREWKSCAENLGNSVQELVDAYAPMLKEYKTLLEAYTRAYEILRDNDLLEEQGESVAA